MQLERPLSNALEEADRAPQNTVASRLASATCALLAATGSQTLQAQDNGWQVDTALLLYQEKDRVQAVEPVVRAAKRFVDDSVLTVKLVLDSLTGASPNGASPTDEPQTFTRPSGAGSYVIPAGDVPLDDTFKDTRTQLAVGYDRPVGDRSRITIGANISSEYDYQSLGVSGSWQRDFNQRNTTVQVGLAFAADTIEPEGGIPIPLAAMQPAGTPQPRLGSDDDKTVTDVIVGLTQVINRRTLMQLNYSYSNVSGYQTDPFKIVSVVDAASGQTLDNIYENRPEDRSKHSIYWQTKYHTTWEDTVDLSLRFMTDDWGIDSTTLDFHYRWNMTTVWYLEPHLRFYQQSAADFYRSSVTNNITLGEFLSADYRLGEFDATTYGAKVGYKFSQNSQVNFRAELYEQRGDTSAGEAIGIQQQFDLFPDLDATILQVGYTYKW